MFKNKLLVMLLKPFMMYADGEDGGGADFDMAAASSAVSEGLFGAEPAEEVVDPPAEEAVVVPPVEVKPEVVAETPPTDPAVVPAVKEVPKTWRPEAASEWAKLPPVIQEEVLKREADIFRGIEALKPDANLGKAFQTALQPFDQFLRQTKADPVRLTQDLISAHTTLSIGSPEQKLAVLQRISAAYGVPLIPPDPNAEPPYIDPQVKALQDQLKAVQSQLSGTAEEQRKAAEAEQTRVRSQLMAEIETFAKDPANKHYATVEGEMSRILSSGMATTLKDAYDQAVWLNPTARAAEQARITAESAQKQREEALAKAEAAKKAAAANVRTSAKQASGTTLLGSIDDTLKETLREINSRT